MSNPQVEFLKAKNGSDCAKLNGIFLHSQYNPQTEAERFAQNAAVEFVPKTVIVIEGALGYCAEPLRKRFPNAKIGTIRLCQNFSATNNLWDFVLGAEQTNTDSKPTTARGGDQQPLGVKSGVPQPLSVTGARISEQLYNLLGEEGIYKTLFLEWQPSARALPERANAAWKEIKAAIEKAKAVLGTREYFGKKWLKNKVNFFSNVSRAAVLEKIEKPVIICASGPSLKAALPLIKNVQQNAFVCALSSATSVLLHNGITPDLCLSTDGGYWAKKHLDILEKQKGIEGVFQPQTTTVKSEPFDIPLALSTEGECAAAMLQNATIVPLCYDDDALSKKLFAALEMPYMTARRNGTVSGTALEFFLANTDCDIFFAGLDLAPGITFAHTQPNALELNAAQKDFRLATKATRIARAALPSPSLDLYAAWFANYSWSDAQKVYRICGKEKFKNNLGKIEDVEASVAENKICHTDLPTPNGARLPSGNYSTRRSCDLGLRAATLKSTISDFSTAPEFANELFPTDSILASRAATIEEKEKYENIILQKTQKLLKEIFRKLK